MKRSEADINADIEAELRRTGTGVVNGWYADASSGYVVQLLEQAAPRPFSYGWQLKSDLSSPTEWLMNVLYFGPCSMGSRPAISS